MFETLARKRRPLAGYTLLSLALHAGVVALVLAVVTLRARSPEAKEVQVSFVGPKTAKAAAPPPPPPAAKKASTTPKRKLVAKLEAPKTLVQPKIEPPPADPTPVADAPEEDDDGVEGGEEGGVVGGVVGGMVGGTGTGGMAPAHERPKAKNVPPFVAQREMIRNVPPRMPEVFKQSHRGQTVTGMYKVCVDLDGSVYEVTAVSPIAGANDEIVEGIKNGWSYKPQQVPICFLYNMVVRVTE